jgi:uncharacterized membrane protein
MRTIGFTFVSVFLLAAVAWAQHGRQPTMPAGGSSVSPAAGKLTDEAKLRYIVVQLNLDDRLELKAEELVAAYAVARKEQLDKLSGDIDYIRSLSARLQEAHDAGDSAKEAEIRQELMDMADSTRLEKDFYRNLRALLSEEQTKLLDETIERLERNPTGELRPADVFRLARSLGLNPEQADKLHDIQVKFRKDVNAAPNFAQQRPQMLADLIEGVRGVLSDAQRQKYDARIESMRMSKPVAPPAGGQ